MCHVSQQLLHQIFRNWVRIKNKLFTEEVYVSVLHLKLKLTSFFVLKFLEIPVTVELKSEYHASLLKFLHLQREKKKKNTWFQERIKCDSTEAVTIGEYSASLLNDLVMTNWKKNFCKKKKKKYLYDQVVYFTHLILLLLNTNFSLKTYHVFHSKFIA